MYGINSLSKQQIESLREYMIIFENVEGLKNLKNKESLQEILYRFEKFLYQNEFILNFDYISWGKTEKVDRYIKNENVVKEANLITIKKLLTYHLRMNRFYEGYLCDVIYIGHMSCIIRRLMKIAKDTLNNN
ncbi:C-5 cytosine-specific DNA methylase family protein (plasmid) [Bacillus cereus 03BB108]|uniref:C-5 cytosine-specific DNA methylase family protein n=1 Tax=Bacillus cereus 03BB108 TaxID=451709 RepID=A0AAN0W4B3_BACCE|nr:C-5 cytosine-specific DNA methylase family protein [Bacillus cereus 03BB108]